MKAINWITAVLVTILFGTAFFLSFQAVSDLAYANGITHSYLYPILLDGFIVTAAMFRLRNSLRGETTWIDVPLILLATVISVAFNVLHAPQALLAQFMAGLIPVALFTSFELLMWMVEKDLTASMHKESREKQWRKRTREVIALARNATAEVEGMQEVNANLQSRVQKQAELLAERESVADAETDVTADAKLHVCVCGQAYEKHQALAGHSRYCDAAIAEREAVSSNGHKE